jgi:hypothetical protein
VMSTFSAAILACRSCWNREEDDCWDREDGPEHGTWVGATVVDMIDWMSAVHLLGSGLRSRGKGRKTFDWCCGA